MLGKGKNCIVCGTTLNLHRHHIFFGVANRNNSEKYDLTCWLCQEHHTGSMGVHSGNNHNLDIKLKKMGQFEFEKTHSRTEFVDTFGRNYL